MIENFLLYGGVSEGVYVFENFRQAMLNCHSARSVLYDDGRGCDGIVKKLIFHLSPGYTLDFDQRGCLLTGCNDSSVMLIGTSPFEGVAKVVLDALEEFASKEHVNFDRSKLGDTRLRPQGMLPA